MFNSYNPRVMDYYRDYSKNKTFFYFGCLVYLVNVYYLYIEKIRMLVYIAHLFLYNIKSYIFKNT